MKLLHMVYWRQFLRRLFPLSAFFSLTILIAYGSVWESSDWALTGTIYSETGYDSNLTTSRDGVGDYFFIAHPYFTFVRRNSKTDFRLNAGVEQTNFLHDRQPSQTDAYLECIHAYPLAENTIPVYRSRVVWEKSSQPIQYLGQRVKRTQYGLNTEGGFPLTGKLGFLGSAEIESIDYKSQKLNLNTKADAFVGIAYKRYAQQEFSLNVGAVAARSKPNDPLRITSNVRSSEYYLTGRIRGEITAKLSGNVYCGFGRASYRGGYSAKRSLPVAGVDLTWGIDPRRTLVLAVYNGAQFTPDGLVTTVTNGMVSFTHVIINHWQYSVRFGPSRASSGRESHQRLDEGWEAGASFEYKPSERFNVRLAVANTKQTSDVAVSQFERRVIKLGAAYRF